MLEEIKNNLADPATLEKLYHSDKKAFKASFDKLSQDLAGSEIFKFWKARLEYDPRQDVLKSNTRKEIFPVLAICLVTAFFIKIPTIFGLENSEDYYMKNGAIIVFMGVALYSLWLNGIKEMSKLIFTGAAFLIPTIYVNFLPVNSPSGAVKLVYIHLPIMMLFIYSVVFNKYDFRDREKRISFIRYLGDLAIFYAMIAIAGAILTAITMGLFTSIGLKIEQFYMENIVMTGATVAPVIASYLIEKFPSLVSRIASLIALIFSPLVLITLVAFLTTMIITGKDPYKDRDFLIVFNVMLLGVMALIIFSASETSVIKHRKFNSLILLALSIITIIIDLVALSAIFYRLGEYGLSPNRLAVLVSNILVLANLVIIMVAMFMVWFRAKDFSIVENIIAGYLPVYLVWIIFVVFGFPVIFGVK